MIPTLLKMDSREQVWQSTIIDCDVHANVPTIEALFEFQENVWVQAVKERGWSGPGGVSLAYPAGAPSTVRPEWRPATGVPASTVEMLQRDILDVWKPECAILNCYYGISSLRHPDWAIALAQSVNDWIIKYWLERDSRLRASIVIPARDPLAAAREIDRVGSHPGFVQVMLPVRSERLYGQRIFWPIYEAIVRNNLVAGIHWGGTSEDAPSPTGYAAWYAEEYAAETQVFASQLTSLIVEGVFQKFPSLRVSMLEGGFAWVPTWGWNMNQKWKALRREIPWVNRSPMDIIRDHFRFSIAPMDLGPPSHMAKIIEWLGTEDILMFATDYPHLHVGDLTELLSIMPERMKAKMMSETARSWYRL
jgi:uncharacterized protein